MVPLGYQPYALVHTAFFLNSLEDFRPKRAAETGTEHRWSENSELVFIFFLSKTLTVSMKHLQFLEE